MSTPEARQRAQERFHQRHPEYRSEAGRRYRQRNPEGARQSTARYAGRTKAAKAARGKAWREANPELVRQYARDYQRRRRQAIEGDLSEIESWMRVLELDPCSYCCSAGGEVDHIVALAVGGVHAIENLAGACKRCNTGKSTACLLAFMLRRARG